MHISYEDPFFRVELTDSGAQTVGNVQRTLQMFALDDVVVDQRGDGVVMTIEIKERGDPEFIASRVKQTIRGYDAHIAHNFVNVKVNPEYL